MKLTQEDMKNRNIDCHTHFGIMLSSMYDDKAPCCQNMVGLIEATINPLINTLITFPFPDLFVGNKILDDEEDNETVRRVFEKIPYKLQNDRLLLETSRFSEGVVLPFLMFSIKYAVDEQIEYLSDVIKEHDVYGMKYYPDADGIDFYTFGKEGKKFIDILIENNLPLTVHTSAETVVSNRGVSNPKAIIKIAEEYPELRVCIAHMAHFSKEVYGELEKKKLRNLFIDTSPFLHLCNIRNVYKSDNCLDLPYSNPQSVLRYMVETYGEHLIWGSDYPFNYTCNLTNDSHNFDFEKFNYGNNIRLLQDLPEMFVEKISKDNTLRFLFGE